MYFPSPYTLISLHPLMAEVNSTFQEHGCVIVCSRRHVGICSCPPSLSIHNVSVLPWSFVLPVSLRWVEGRVSLKRSKTCPPLLSSSFGRLYSLLDRSPSLDCCSRGSHLLTVLGLYDPRCSLILSLYLNLLSYYGAVLDPSFPRYIILLADLENLILSSDLAGLLRPLEFYVPRLVCYPQPSPVFH